MALILVALLRPSVLALLILVTLILVALLRPSVLALLIVVTLILVALLSVVILLQKLFTPFHFLLSNFGSIMEACTKFLRLPIAWASISKSSLIISIKPIKFIDRFSVKVQHT